MVSKNSRYTIHPSTDIWTHNSTVDSHGRKDGFPKNLGTLCCHSNDCGLYIYFDYVLTEIITVLYFISILR